MADNIQQPTVTEKTSAREKYTKMKISGFILIISTIVCSVTLALGRVSLIAQQSQGQVLGQVRAATSMENIMAISMNTAIHACQNSFKWDRWNCPRSDFLIKGNSKYLLLDHEDSYVKAIFTASVLYTITKNCSSGVIAGCNTCSDSLTSSYCSDDPKAAAELFRQHFVPDLQDNLSCKIAQHNYRAVTNLLEKSLKERCICSVAGANGECSKEICIQVLKPFEELASDVRQMYEEGLQLDNTSENTRIMWHNIPLDVLLYVRDSPNYCEPYATPQWKGMRGRQCTPKINGKNITKEDRERCRHLCRECGYTVVSRNVVAENRCNCKLDWGYKVQCEVCATVQKQYYCY